MFWRGRQERVGEEAKGEGRGEPQSRRASVRELGLQNQKVRGDLEERVPKGAGMVEEKRVTPCTPDSPHLGTALHRVENKDRSAHHGGDLWLEGARV